MRHEVEVNRVAIGVCSWSLRPRDAADLAARVRWCGLGAVQLALDPVREGRWDEGETAARLWDAGVAVLSGMMGTEGEDYSTLESIARTGGVRMDATWGRNLEAAKGNAAVAARIGLKLVTFHAGFLPHGAGERAERGRMIERVRAVADAFGSAGVDVALETGQESAETLEDVIREMDHPRVGVNFDPGNMVLYGMGEPVAALKRLAPWVRQVHVKDARPAERAGEWGTEVRVGTGVVDWAGLFRVVRERLKDVDLVIEREAGESREADIAAAREVVARHMVGA